MRRSSPTRVLALLLALLASLTAPRAALAHGLAHHREHVHTPHAHALWLEDGASEDRGLALAGTEGTHEQPMLAPDETHEHPTFDRPLPLRGNPALVAVIVSAAAVLLAPERRVSSAMPRPHASLPRADPDAAPLPRLRAPPAL